MTVTDRKRSLTYLIETTSVLITVIDAHGTTVDGHINADAEVFWHEGCSIAFKSNVTLEELTLGDTRVRLLWLSDHQ